MILKNGPILSISLIYICYICSCFCQELDVNASKTMLNAEEPITPNTTTTVRANMTEKIVVCKESPVRKYGEDYPSVSLVNYTHLLEVLISDPEITNKNTEAPCVAVLFYSTVCPFSCSAAPHYNALARAFPNIKMLAIDSRKYHNANTQYAIVGVPTLLLFHNARPVAKFNGSEYNIYAFSKFIKTYTEIREEVLFVKTEDFQGPVPSMMEKEIDYYLILSWVFLTVCGLFFFSKSPWWKRIVEMVQSTWREAAAQHEHVD